MAGCLCLAAVVAGPGAVRAAEVLAEAVALQPDGSTWIARVQAQGDGWALVVQRPPAAPLDTARLLPPGLARSAGEWRLLGLDWQGRHLTLGLAHYPAPGSGRLERRFVFDLARADAALVGFHTATYRAGRVDWMRVDWPNHTAEWCNDVAEATPLRCRPMAAEFDSSQPPATLDKLGPAFDYSPPIRRPVLR